jgi:broad specificity phosphatase PhoE
MLGSITLRMNELWLIRHGETAWTLSKQHTGRNDIPMTEAGEKDASALKHLLNGKTFQEVYVSPLRRAQDTCRLAGYSSGAKITPEIMEWDYGDYEGRTPEEIRREIPDWTIWTYGCPGGETIDDVANRAKKIISNFTEIHGDVALFSHGHFLRILTACILELPPATARLLMLDTSSISILARDNGRMVIKNWNLGVKRNP